MDMTSGPGTVRNDGEQLVGTNYFDTPPAKAGYPFVSINAAAFRVLVPPSCEAWIDEMRRSEYLIATQGLWRPSPGESPREAIELLFEDQSDSPFVMYVVAEQVDRMPSRRDSGRADLHALVYTAGPTLALRMPARFRTHASLPYCRPWS